MVEWGVCGEGKEWEGLCVGMPSIARAAAGNDANPRLQPATSQTDNEHDASLWRRIPPLAVILPCHRHLVNHPTAFPAVGRASPTAWPLAGAEKNFSFPWLRQRFRPGLPVPKAGRESCGQTNTSEKLARHLREVLPCRPHQATSASHTAQTRGIPPVPLPSRPCLPHLAYWRHRHDAGTKPSGGYE